MNEHNSSVRPDGLYRTDIVDVMWLAKGWWETNSYGDWVKAIHDDDFFYEVEEEDRKGRSDSTTLLIPEEML